MSTPTAPRSLHILGIDWQRDFCDPNGSLFVAGADADAKRFAAFLKRVGPRTAMVHMTLDSHQVDHIAHAANWRGKDGKPPGIFTTITVDDVRNGVWRAASPQRQAHFLTYVEALAVNKRYDLTIWPEHCLIGSQGHNVVPEVWEELTSWSRAKLRSVNYVTKGSNRDTEHYSAMQADVPVATDPSTKLNTGFLRALQQADILAITGQASSHCVANTVRDIAANFGPEEVKKFVIFRDLMSPVPPAKALADAFFVDMAALGVTIVDDSTKFLA